MHVFGENNLEKRLNMGVSCLALYVNTRKFIMQTVPCMDTPLYASCIKRLHHMLFW